MQNSYQNYNCMANSFYENPSYMYTSSIKQHGYRNPGAYNCVDYANYSRNVDSPLIDKLNGNVSKYPVINYNDNLSATTSASKKFSSSNTGLNTNEKSGCYESSTTSYRNRINSFMSSLTWKKLRGVVLRESSTSM